jgi:hypothetical protein
MLPCIHVARRTDRSPIQFDAARRTLGWHLSPAALQQWPKHLAVSAQLHLLAPIALHLAFAEGPVDEPAKSTSFEFPCWTPVPDLSRAPVHHPARLLLKLLSALAESQEKDLPFHVNRQ